MNIVSSPLLSGASVSRLAFRGRAQAPRPAIAGDSGPGSVFLPKEHGSWSLALEPLALGLIVAPSFAGGAMAAVALAVFFARRPFKIAFAPLHSARRREAREAVVMLMALALAGAFEAYVLSSPTAWWPLALAAPLAAVFAWFDAQGESRAAAAELAGSAAFAVLPVTFASLAGWSWPAAVSLGAIALTRSVPAVITVRTFLRLRKSQPTLPTVAIVTSVVALAAIVGLAAEKVVPLLAAIYAALLLARTVWLVTSIRPKWSAKHIGMMEAMIGLAYVAGIAIAYRA